MQKSHIDVQNLHAECRSEPGSDGLDSIISGLVRLNGKLIEMDAKAEIALKSRRVHFTLQNKDKDLTHSGVFADYRMTVEEAAAITRLSVLFWGIMYGWDATFMLLRPIRSENKQLFERVGIFRFPTEENAGSMERINRWINACEFRENICIV